MRNQLFSFFTYFFSICITVVFKCCTLPIQLLSESFQENTFPNLTFNGVSSGHLIFFINFQLFVPEACWIKNLFFFFEKSESINTSCLSSPPLRFKIEKKNTLLFNKKTEDNLEAPLYFTGSDFSSNEYGNVGEVE